MAFVQEQAIWEEGIRQFELDDPVMGGVDGVDNIPLKQLANRTSFLKQQVEEINEGGGGSIVGEYRYLSFQPTPLQLAENRLLELQHQIIEIALYPELCALKYVGDDQNETADWWYKCDEDGTRNVSGLYMRVEDPRGLFFRAAGANALKTASDGTPYDGGEPGAFESFGTKGAPDYSSASTTNLMGSLSDSYTVPESGYFLASYDSNGAGSFLKVNNEFVQYVTSSSSTAIAGVFFASKGDLIQWQTAASRLSGWLYYIPPQQNAGSIAVYPCITY
jgi:hypothetical protein